MRAAPVDRIGTVTRGELFDVRDEIVRDLQTGTILIPQVQSVQANIAGGTSHCPNSDISYSTMAATTAAITPATAGDTNLEAYRIYRQVKGANLTIAAANALKATGHSLFAANETATPAIPRWDRVNGWIEIGASGGTQYDIAVHLLNLVVGPGQRWFVRFRCAALNGAIVPANVEAFAGFWEKRAATEGYLQGGAFTLSHSIIGAPGATSTDYRVLAKTDSGVSILSNVLTVANAPNALSNSNYIKLYYNAGPGFIEFQIYKLVGGNYYHVYTVRNSTDLQYNDTGSTLGAVTGWPSAAGSAPQAYAETNDLIIAPFGGVWTANDLTIDVPSTYDFSQAVSQYLRLGLTNPTGVDRHLGIDRIWLSTTYNEWAPDGIAYPSPPSISPTSGTQGGGGGVYTPPPGGSGGGTCIVTNMPVLTADGGLKFRQFKNVQLGARLKSDGRVPSIALRKRTGSVSEYYQIKTANGIRIACSVDHCFIVDLDARKRISARHVEPGTRLACWVKGRRAMTTVVSKLLVPIPVEVGTFTLRDQTGLRRDGDGLYVAGHSREMDRGLFCHNNKLFDPL